MRTNSRLMISGAIVALLLVAVASVTIEFAGTPPPELYTNSATQSINSLDFFADSYDNPRIAVVKPIFTCTAYTNAFYDFYSKYASSTVPFITTDLELLNVTAKDGWRWSAGLARFLSSVKASTAGLSLGQSLALIDEIDVTMGALFDNDTRVYDVVILGFTEYVTQEEYNHFKRFVAIGGTLIILDACNFLAEVEYYPPTSPDEAGHLSLVKGHGWEFNGTHAWRSVYHRWPEDNRNWVGSNFWKWWTGTHYDFFQANTSHPISVYIRNNYKQNVTSRYRAHEENKLENLTNTQIIGYWHFIDPAEAPEDPVVAYQHKYGAGYVFHTGIMASDVIDDEEFLQSFLIGAVRMGLGEEVGEGSFWKDSSFQSLTSLCDENGIQIAQTDPLSGIVSFYVDFNTSIIVQNKRMYSLTSVHALISRLNSNYPIEPIAINGSIFNESSLYWHVEVNTWDLVDAEYEFKIGCRFTSVSNSSDCLDSTLLVTLHEVKNIPDEIKNSLYIALGSFAAILALVYVYIMHKGRR
ncbi:MAG: hypothetical protein ACW975_00465 [Candidatus Thorarchaeota archaeon]